jgi:hypothetical protein
MKACILFSARDARETLKRGLCSLPNDRAAPQRGCRAKSPPSAGPWLEFRPRQRLSDRAPHHPPSDRRASLSSIGVARHGAAGSGAAAPSTTSRGGRRHHLAGAGAGEQCQERVEQIAPRHHHDADAQCDPADNDQRVAEFGDVAASGRDHEDENEDNRGSHQARPRKRSSRAVISRSAIASTGPRG